MCTLTVVAGLGLAPAANAAKKPDLVIAGASIEGKRYAFQGEPGGMFGHDITRNRGSAAAGPSITRAFLVNSSPTPRPLGSRPVARLGPAKQSAGDDEQAGNKYEYPIGPYYMEICADATNVVAESNESNNCIFVKDGVGDRIPLFIIRRKWEGTIGGYAQRGFELEQYHSSNARLVFDKPVDAADGRFAYDFAGPVTYRDSGDNGFCTYSGGDTQTFGPGGATANDNILFDYLSLYYAGGASVNGDFYTIHLDCGSSHTTTGGPAIDQFLNLGDHSPLHAKHLGGSIQTSGQTWTWGFS